MYPDETRHCAVVHYKYFLRSLRKVAGLYQVAKSTLQRWVRQAPPTDKRANRGAQPTKPREVVKQAQAAICSHLTYQPFSTMQQVAEMLFQKLGLRRSSSTACRWTRSAGFTRKKAFRTVQHRHDNSQILGACNAYLTAHSANQSRLHR